MKIEPVSCCSSRPVFTSTITSNRFMEICEFGSKYASGSSKPALKEINANYNKALDYFKNDGKSDVITFDFKESHLPTAIGYSVAVNNVVKTGGLFFNNAILLGTQCCKAVVSFAKDCGMKV